MKKIAFGCDHAGFAYKDAIVKRLEEKGYEVVCCGTDSAERCDYPIYAHKVCVCVQSKACELGILVCGTGIGMSIAANKHRGIRAAVCMDTFSARLTREHNDSNVLCLGARVIGLGLALDLVDAYIHADFTGEEKHTRRLALISELEEKDLI
jgi:ribose 5-phosphate isomerase B